AGQEEVRRRSGHFRDQSGAPCSRDLGGSSSATSGHGWTDLFHPGNDGIEPWAWTQPAPSRYSLRTRALLCSGSLVAKINVTGPSLILRFNSPSTSPLSLSSDQYRLRNSSHLSVSWPYHLRS